MFESYASISNLRRVCSPCAASGHSAVRMNTWLYMNMYNIHALTELKFGHDYDYPMTAMLAASCVYALHCLVENDIKYFTSDLCK